MAVISVFKAFTQAAAYAIRPSINSVMWSMSVYIGHDKMVWIASYSLMVFRQRCQGINQAEDIYTAVAFTKTNTVPPIHVSIVYIST